MKKGQIKVQEMAFVLIAVIVFFSLIALIYLSVKMSNLKNSVETLRENEAQEIVRKIASTAELAWLECPGCIDSDKALAVKERVGNRSYGSLWELDYLVIEWTYPNRTGGECTAVNYPECSKITLINKEQYGITSSTFVSLCRWDETIKDSRCELGRVYASGKGVANGK